MNNAIYLDHNASTPIDAQVAEAMRPYLDNYYGNPISSHVFGQKCRQAIEHARRQCAEMLGCDLDEVIFTSGGTESNNMAIRGIAFANQHKGNHIITSVIEHPAVLEVCKYLERNGFYVTYVKVDEEGLIHPDEVEKAIRPETIMISVMHANNEVGSIQDIEALSYIAHSHDIILHTDAAQSIGKIAVDVNSLGIDLLTLAGHKLCAPKGIGALYIRRGIMIENLMYGAAHEFGLRPGTENVLEIVGLGKACNLVTGNLTFYSEHMRAIRNKLENEIIKNIPIARINGTRQNRLPNTSSIGFHGIRANEIMTECPTLAVSAGAACHADQVDMSHVLQAMHVPVEYGMGTIRFSVGRDTKETDVEYAAVEISKTIMKLQR